MLYCNILLLLRTAVLVNIEVTELIYAEDDNVLLSILRQSKAKELHVDSMALLSGMKPHDVLGELSILEITGRVERRSGNVFTLVL
jgi:predicted Rossmann fold nucleotide-binding protein DprA/Smf involved in DNA uptake